MIKIQAFPYAIDRNFDLIMATIIFGTLGFGAMFFFFSLLEVIGILRIIFRWFNPIMEWGYM